MELSEIDEENISAAAKFGWYKPLTDRMIQGKKINSFLVCLYCDEIMQLTFLLYIFVSAMTESSRKPCYLAS